MSLKLNVGISKKIGQPGYGSLGASCNVEVELDQSLAFDDPEGFQERVTHAFNACRQAVNEELDRRHELAPPPGSEQRPASEEESVEHTSNGSSNGHNGHRATQKQLDYVAHLAGQIQGLGARRLEGLADKMFSKPLADLSSLDASGLIDMLKEIKVGKVGANRCARRSGSMNGQFVNRDSLAARGSRVLDYVSASRLSLWLKCPLAFRLKYVDGIEMPSSPAVLVGKAVHAGLECFYRHRQLSLSLHTDQVVEQLVESWNEFAGDERVVFRSTAEETALREQACQLVRTYLDRLSQTEPPPLAVEVALEATLVDPASSEDLGIPLVGVIDLVLPDAAGPIIADFKTTSRSGEPLEVMHEVQLSCYSYLFRQASPLAEASLQIRNLVKTRLPKVEFHTYAARDERHFERLFGVIRAYLDDVHAGRFLFRPGWGCMACDYRGVCAAHQ